MSLLVYGWPETEYVLPKMVYTVKFLYWFIYFVSVPLYEQGLNTLAPLATLPQPLYEPDLNTVAHLAALPQPLY